MLSALSAGDQVHEVFGFAAECLKSAAETDTRHRIYLKIELPAKANDPE